MTVYVIKNAEGETLEICSSIGSVFRWICAEIEDSFRVSRTNGNFSIVSESECYEVIKWAVYDES